MNQAEFSQFAAVIQARWWAFPLPPQALDQYLADIADLRLDAAMVALDAFSMDGRERPPTSGQLRRKVVELQVDAPDWGTAWRYLLRCAKATGSIYSSDRYKVCRRVIEGEAPDEVRRFVEHVGYLEVYRTWSEDGSHAEPRMRQKWEAYIADRLAGRSLASLPPVEGLKRIDRARRSEPTPIAGAITAIAETVGP